MFYIVGDFNINLLQYEHDNKVQHYVDLLNCYDCRHIVTKPTRINQKNIKRSSLLEHIYTNDCKYSITPGILVIDTSDHFPIFLEVNWMLNKPKNEIRCAGIQNTLAIQYTVRT